MNQSTNSYPHTPQLIWWNFILQKKWTYCLGIFAVFMTNFLQVMAPKNLGWIIDFFNNESIPALFMGKTKETTFLYLFLFLIVTRIFINVFRFMWRVTLGRQTHYACSYLKQGVWNEAVFINLQDLRESFTKGDLMAMQISDANSARFIFGFTLVAIFDLFFLGAMTLFAMSQIHLPMTIVALIVMLSIPVIVRKISDLEILQYKLTQEKQGELNENCSQSIACVKQQRLNLTEDIWRKKLMDQAQNFRMEKLKSTKLSLSYIPVMGTASLISFLILFYYGTTSVLNGKMSVGDFVSMQGLIFLLQDPLMSCGFIISEWKKAMAGLSRLSELYHFQKDPDFSGVKLRPHEKINLDPAPLVELKNVSFSYKAGKQIFQNFNLKVFPGEKLAITGSVGSGKTTLSKIILGLEKVQNGQVSIEGLDIEAIDRQFLTTQYLKVQQKAFIFAGTIASNISLDLKLTDEELWKILEVVELKEDVLKFDRGLQTELGEWGVNLSGGQKQRLNLARTIVRKPKFLILDDSFSAIDVHTEEKILNQLKDYLKETTLIWIAHRESTLRFCSRRLHLEAQ